MDMSQFTGSSDFLKAADIGSARPRVKVKSVNSREFRQQDGETREKPLLEFEGKDKMMVLNLGQTRKMVDAFGAESDKWVGQELELYVEETPMGPGLRVNPSPVDFNDEIPF